MTKDLSKQICEKCGIEPKRKRDGGIYYQVYPDFGQPENFVKLFELRTWLLGSLTDTLTTLYNIRDIKTYLEAFNDYLNNRILPEEKEELNRIIREAEWKYE